MLKKSKNKKRIIWLGLILIGVGVFIFIKKSNGHVLVEPVKLASVNVRKTVSASGTVVSQDEVDVSFPTSGRIEGIAVEKGDLIEMGDLLAYITNYDTTQSVQAYKDARDVAEQDIEIYIENYSSNLQAAGGEDEYNLNLKRLRELLSKAEANYQSSIGTLSKSYLYSPISGTVVDIYKEGGEVTTIAGEVMKIADLDNLYFEVSVDQEDFGLISIGMPVEVMLDSYEDYIFKGKVLDLPKYADTTSGEFEIKIQLESDNTHTPLLGMVGDADIIIEERSDTKAVTFDTVYYSDNETFVWVEKDGKAYKQPVNVGLEGDVYTVIESQDIENLNIIIPSDDVELADGAKVKFKE